MASISVPVGLVAAAGIGAVGSLAAGSLSASAAKSAAQTQANATNNATQAQLDMYATARGDLLPYSQAGLQPTNNLVGNLQPGGSLSQMYPQYQYFDPTMQQLEQTPGYQFTLDQGLKALTNQNSAQGLAGSGAHAKALENYAQGLASTTYNQQLANYEGQYGTGLQAFQGQQQNLYNRLLGVASLGSNAAAGQATNAIQTGSQVGSNLIGAGNALAAGQVGAANAYGGAVTGITNAGSNMFLANQLLRQNSSTTNGSIPIGDGSGMPNYPQYQPGSGGIGSA